MFSNVRLSRKVQIKTHDISSQDHIFLSVVLNHYATIGNGRFYGHSITLIPHDISVAIDLENEKEKRFN